MNYVNNIVDCHMHIVPDFDDGSANLKMSMEMLRSAYNQGVRTVFCTSHSYVYDDLGINYYNKQFNLLREALKKEGLDINIYVGEELYCYHSIDKIIKNLNEKKYHSYNDTKYVLLEFDPQDSKKYTTYSVKKIIEVGYTPVIAHVERYFRFVDCDDVERWKKLGAHIQINVFSLYDETNFFIKLFAREMLDRKLVDVIGSDAHRTTHRPPIYANGIQYILDHCNEDYANKIIHGNAERFFNI